jgi:septal ring factor EnvC (AmiA/AmiB activator)
MVWIQADDKAQRTNNCIKGRERMSKRMTDERLVEIESKCEINGTQMYFGELLQALKADREHIAELEAVLIDAERDWEDERRKVRELEAQLAAVRAYADQCARLWVEPTTTGLLKALAGEEDE